MTSISTVLLGAVLVLAAANLVLYAIIIRRILIKLGATDKEARETLPGDDILNTAQVQVTNAISIDAKSQDVWPWLIQIGQGRGGFYTYTWLQNLLGLHMSNANEIKELWQHLEEDYLIRLTPEGYWRTTYMQVKEINAPNTLVFGIPDFPINDVFLPDIDASWAFILRDEEDSTRLITRVRAHHPNTVIDRAIQILLEPWYVLLTWRMLRSIKQRVEQEK